MRFVPKVKPSPWDTLVVAGIVLMAVGCFAWLQHTAGTGALEVVIATDGTVVETIALSSVTEETHRTIDALGYTLDVVITPTSVEVVCADCPTQDCVHTGLITQAGQSIVCLPGRTSLRLVGGDEPEVDVVIG